MNPVLRLVGVVFVFFFTAVAWLILAGVMSTRTSETSSSLDGRVSDLWGSPQAQAAPAFQLEWNELVSTTQQVTDASTGRVTTVVKQDPVLRTTSVDPSQTRIDVGLRLDQRRKGLLWFPLYDVDFAGAWAYTHVGVPRTLRLTFLFPDRQGVYDDLRFVVDGVDRARDARPVDGAMTWTVSVVDDQHVAFEVGYRSRGMREWTYQPTAGVGQIENFTLDMTTDFARVDYPRLTMSPSSAVRDGEGWRLSWTFARLVSGYGIGMVMPERIQPGALAASMSLTAALPLGLYFLWIYVLGVLRGTNIHPINYLFIAGAFFSFNLLFGYTADHLPIEGAFALASGVSVLLVVSYLRLVVGATFALREAGLAQLLYQVGFSLAHFWDGFTGLSITVLGVITLFALMQLTGRIDWSKALSASPASD